MDLSGFLPAVIGGIAIGAASAMLLWFNGRIAGISGILGGLVRPVRGDMVWRGFFLAGLLAGGLVIRQLMPQSFPDIEASLPLIVAAGFLVGFGARFGSGCTSGHGVCGIGRLSKRGIAATLTFMATGAVTVFILRHVVGGGA